MSLSDPRAHSDEQVLEEACEWFIDCNEAEFARADRDRFNEWLRRSPEHVRAYLEIACTWDDSSALRGPLPLDVSSLVAAAVTENSVVALNPRAPEPETVSRKPLRLSFSTMTATATRTLAIAATITAAAAALLAIGITLMPQRDTYTTRAGELRSIALSDGSEVQLDTRSWIRVRFSRTARSVELVDGQALFRVKNDPARPFTVLSSGTQLRDVGTQFNVYRKGTTTAVTVIEGRVAVTQTASTTPYAGAGPSLLLSAGEQSIVTPNSVPTATRADVAAATAWTQRKLIFDETPLSDAVAEFNRYSSRRIVIADPTLATYHIRGDFEADDPERLLRFLRDRFNADIHEHGNEIRISRK